MNRTAVTGRWNPATARPPTRQLEGGLLDVDEVARLLGEFKRGFESHSNAERKHLLHRLVKEVRVQSKVSAEVWYAFPRPKVQEGAFVDSQIWLLR